MTDDTLQVTGGWYSFMKRIMVACCLSAMQSNLDSIYEPNF